jgi:hypothetical protein
MAVSTGLEARLADAGLGAKTGNDS